MTSRKSFINNFGYAYRTGLRDNIVPALIQLVMGMFFFVYMPATMLFKKTSINPETNQMEAVNIKEMYQFLLTDQMQYARYLIIAAFLIIGILMGIVTFKFMTGKKTMNVYYSLGIKRVNMFTAKYLSGLTLMALAVLIPIAIDVFMNISAIGLNGKLISAALYYFLGLFSLSMFSYSLTAAVFSTVGTAFEGIVFSGILVSTPAILLASLQSLIETLVSGTPYGVIFVNSNNYDNGQSLLTELYKFTPFMYLSRGLFEFQSADKKGQLSDYTTGEAVAWKSPEILLVLAWIALAVAFVFLAMFLYNRRKAEIGGFIGKNKVLNFICTFIIGFFGFVTVISNLTMLSMTVRVLIALGVFAIIYIVLDLLLIRNFRMFLKKTYKLPIHLGIALVIFIFFFTGYFGIANKIPKTEDISYVQVSSSAQSYNGNFSSSSWRSVSFGAVEFSQNKLPDGKYESASDIAKIQEIHQRLSGKMPATANDVENSLDNNYPQYIKIIYKLKNGKEVKRAYYGIDRETFDKLLELEKSDYQSARLHDTFYGEYKTDYDLKALRKSIMENDLPVVNEYNFNQYKRALQSDDSLVIFYNKLLDGGKELNLTAAQRKELLDCLYNDITNMTAQQVFNPKETLGILGFSALNVDFSEVDKENQVSYGYGAGTYQMSEQVEQEVYKEGYSTLFDYSGYITNSPNYFITPEMTRTIGFLKSAGVYDEVLNIKPQISEVRVSKIADEYRYMDYYISNRNEVGRELLVQSKGKGYLGNSSSYIVKDSELINDLYSKAKARAIVDPENGYALFFVVDDEPVILYINGNDLPQSVKENADKMSANNNNLYY